VPLTERLLAYKDLAKLTEWGAFLSVPLVWSALEPDHRTSGYALGLLALSLVTQVGFRTVESALDDVAGVRDGIDVVNYAAPSEHRVRARKPLLDGRLTEQQAKGYAYFAATVATIAFVAGLAIADFEPLWVPFAAAGAAFLVVTYSAGPKLSYRGGQEIVVISGLAVAIYGTYAVIEGSLSGAVATEGLLLGIWLMQPVTFANLHDLEGDRQAGRATMAVRLSAEGNRRYILGLFALGWTVLLTGIVLGALDWWVVLFLVPCFAIQHRALRDGLWRGEPLLARRLCHLAYRVGWLGLFCANLVALG
jgi:1,4-dihydroxy-2-naphthoate octaprenyltransferase